MFYLIKSSCHEGPYEPEDGDCTPYDIAPETPFTPNDVLTYEELPANPEIEMSEWMPEEIQEKFGRKMRYYAMDMNVPRGEILFWKRNRWTRSRLSLKRPVMSASAMMICSMPAITLDFDPDDYQYINEDDECE